MYAFFSLIFALNVFALSPELKVGDVLLQPLKCWACTLIEAEEKTIYSHAGVVLRVKPSALVAEAFGNVRVVSLEEFNAKTEVGQKIGIYRFQNDQLVKDIDVGQNELMKIFQNDFENLKYDHDFRWNNFDEDGNEKLYCSEMISKLFQSFVQVEIPVKRMHFNQNRDQWMIYFKGNIPDGEWGNAPADIQRSELFYFVGEL